MQGRMKSLPDLFKMFQKSAQKNKHGNFKSEVLVNAVQQSQQIDSQQSIDEITLNNKPRQVDGYRYLRGRPTDQFVYLHSQYSTSKYIISYNGRLRIQIREIFPSFLTPWYKDLMISYQSTDFKIVIFEKQKPIPQYQDVLKVSIEEDEKQNSMLIVTFTLQMGQSIEVTLPLEKQFKQFEQYPNDPQRGHDIMPSLIRYGPHAQGEEVFFEDSTLVESNSLLVFINQPDFSMPFNVIAVTSGVIGFLFIHLFNIAMSTGTSRQEDNRIHFQSNDQC